MQTIKSLMAILGIQILSLLRPNLTMLTNYQSHKSSLNVTIINTRLYLGCFDPVALNFILGTIKVQYHKNKLQHQRNIDGDP